MHNTVLFVIFFNLLDRCIMLYERFINEKRDEPMLYYCDRDDRITPGARYGPVIRDIYIVECCTAGYGSVIINNKEFPVGPGDCFILFPGDTIIHTADVKEPRCGVWCAIDGLQVSRAVTAAGITSDAPFAPRHLFSEITKSVDAMVKMRNDTDPGADLRRTGLVYSIIGALMRCGSVTRADAWVQKAIGIMETQYHTELPVAKIAEECALERTYFSTLFKSRTGKSPYAYLTEIRIKKACVLMKENGMTVSDAAGSVGLDARNFARLFKRITGKTPMDFIKKRGSLPLNEEI